MDLRTLFRAKKYSRKKPGRSGSTANWKRLLRNDRGAVAPMFLISSVAVLGTSLGAIDLVRFNVVQGRLQAALDGATLSAGRNLANLTPEPGVQEGGQWQEDAFQYFRANFPEGYFGSQIQPENMVISYAEEFDATGVYMTGQHIQMSVEGSLPLLSTGFLKLTSFDIKAGNQAVRRTRSDLEVVMALDNTGSMGSDGKLDTLKTAARELASIVLGASAVPGGPQKVYVGLVPFADTVTVGNTAVTRAWLTDADGKNTYPDSLPFDVETHWGGCIVEPPPSLWGGSNLPAQVHQPYGSGFQPLFAVIGRELTRNNLGLSQGGSNFERIVPSTADSPQPRSYATNPNAALSRDRRLWAQREGSTSFKVFSAHNPSNCNNTRLARFLSNDLDTINSAIDAMQANGNTLIPTGLLWAWRMLHPDWKGSWGEPDMPRDAEPNSLTKVIVLLTDGENVPSSSVSANGSDDKSAYILEYDKQRCTDSQRRDCPGAPELKTYVADGTVGGSSLAPTNSLKMRSLSEMNDESIDTSIGWSSGPMSTATVDNYLTEICDNITDDTDVGIKIYTVTLGNVGNSTETRMNECSSGAGFYYNATNVSDLPQVFRSIAGALTELRLTE